uniref:Glutathione S-transferase rho n=1 Tax=Callorhinchus milii TaxID=7868 RepID=A0A4W3IUB5_CALMI
MADSMVVFWGSGSPPCWRVMIALEEKLLSGYQRRLLSFEKQQHKSKEVLAINPRGQNQFKSQGAELIPSCPTEQAGVLQRMFEVQTLQEKMGIVIYYKWRVPENEQHDTAVERNKKALSVELKLWEGYMEKASPEPYIMGKNFTMADVMLFPQLAYGVRFALSQEKYPKLLEYYHRLEKRPSIQASWPPHWKESAPTSDILKDI